MKADTADSSSDKRIVISIYGGSGSGKTTIAAALQQYFLNDNTACYVLTGDNYPHRIPMRNDEERLNVYNESGEDGLRGYLGTPKEIDFDRINKELSEFKAGKDIIEIKHMAARTVISHMTRLISQESKCSSWSGPTEEANTLRVLIYLYSREFA